MLAWLKKGGGGKPWQNKAGLDEKALGLLAEDLGALEKVEADLPAAVMRYVLDGDGEELLARLAGTQGAGEALGLINIMRHSGKDGNARSRFFDCARCNDPVFFTRLGKVYEAASQCQNSKLASQLPQVASQMSQTAFNDPRLSWLESLLVEATQLSLNSWPRRCRACPALNAELIEAMLKGEGHSPDVLVRAAFQPQVRQYWGPPLEPVFQSLAGFADSAVRHRQGVLEALDQPDFKKRVYALGLLKTCKVPVAPFAEKLVELALGSSKQVREQAEALLAEAKPDARPLLEGKLAIGSHDERAAAARLLWQWDGENVRAVLEQRLAEEKNKKVVQTIQSLLAAGPAKSASTSKADNLQLPVLPPLPSQVPLGAETERAWRECFEKINFAITHVPGGKPSHHGRGLKPVAADAITQAFAFLQVGGQIKPVLGDLFSAGFNKEIIEQLKLFWQRPELQLLHLVRFLVQVGALKSDREQDRSFLSYGHWFETLLPAFRRTHPEAGLRELGAAFTAAGLDARRIGTGWLGRFWGGNSVFGMAKAQVWPYWSENLNLLAQAFAPSTGDFMARYYQRYARVNAFEALAAFPMPPEPLVPLLWNLALGPKSERPQAQRSLESVPDKLDRLILALSTGSAETRLAAAEWLGRTGEAAATTALLTALKKEKNEAAKGAMMTALEQLGVPVEQFLDRDGLLKEAVKGLAKGIPADLKWFPFERLPVVHWEENGKPVEPEIVRWWLAQGFKLKSPEPGPLLRKYCASLKAAEREALGQFVLEAWLGEDTAPIPRADAEKRAQQQAQQYVQWTQTSYWPQNSPKKTAEEFYADFLPGFLLQPKGSVVSSKGILSLAGACAGAEAAPIISRYLKQWYGMRAAQCRALLQMLGWVSHKTATQLLLAVGSRFRTKSIQEEANKQALALAERKGWTVAELSDRTIPTAGLDDEGVLLLDFGPRQFTAKLNENLEFDLADGDRKALKSLPDPRKDDDEAKAAEAKKVYSAAKKELKSVVAMQRDRFYEAMCTQRTWPFEDWNTYLNRHPIARHHCQRLVWSVIRDEKIALLFRPLPDGSLTDAADEPVGLAAEDQVRVAHECQITPEQSQAWRLHLKDYEIEPLFEQFGRPNFELNEERKQEDELADFRGHLLETFKLRGRANKLGYMRGQAQDGGWFFDYHKRFPTLGMEAIIEFTGNGLPEENRTVALTLLRFERVAGDGEPSGGSVKMSLSEVPPVLLSECWNDIRALAAEGPGFDADWEKKTQM